MDACMYSRVDGRVHGYIVHIPGSFATSGSQYETYTWPPVFYDIACTGEETTLWDCPYGLSDVGQTCGFDAAVTCQGNGWHCDTAECKT